MEINRSGRGHESQVNEHASPIPRDSWPRPLPFPYDSRMSPTGDNYIWNFWDAMYAAINQCNAMIDLWPKLKLSSAKQYKYTMEYLISS